MYEICFGKVGKNKLSSLFTSSAKFQNFKTMAKCCHQNFIICNHFLIPSWNYFDFDNILWVWRCGRCIILNYTVVYYRTGLQLLELIWVWPVGSHILPSLMNRCFFDDVQEHKSVRKKHLFLRLWVRQRSPVFTQTTATRSKFTACVTQRDACASRVHTTIVRYSCIPMENQSRKWLSFKKFLTTEYKISQDVSNPLPQASVKSS